MTKEELIRLAEFDGSEARKYFWNAPGVNGGGAVGGGAVGGGGGGGAVGGGAVGGGGGGGAVGGGGGGGGEAWCFEQGAEYESKRLMPLIRALAESCEEMEKALAKCERESSQDACKPLFWDEIITALANHTARMAKLNDPDGEGLK
jgi:hypothetical protein